MQGSTILTQYMNDQLKEDMKRDELVASGKVSQMEADDEAAVWAEVRVRSWRRVYMFGARMDVSQDHR